VHNAGAAVKGDTKPAVSGPGIGVVRDINATMK
jgi:hypothetical protein